ncbi:MAG: hypothetical protein NVV72_14780 [Asticcacaulis sp.]|nr:hypothetical protein [Asticcacaulis sp.]
MKRFSLVAVALVAVVAVSGAEAKEYKAAAKPGDAGYFNVLEEGGFWTVGYTGEPGQSNREIAEYAMRRAGDLAAEQHKEWFAVLTTTNRMVQLGVADDLQMRAGNFMGSSGGANTSAPVSGAPASNSRNNTGTFGGEAVPNSVLERWEPRKVRQTLLVIELGSGDNASFPGLDHTPEIFPATGAASAPSPKP